MRGKPGETDRMDNRALPRGDWFVLLDDIGNT